MHLVHSLRAVAPSASASSRQRHLGLRDRCTKESCT